MLHQKHHWQFLAPRKIKEGRNNLVSLNVFPVEHQVITTSWGIPFREEKTFSGILTMGMVHCKDQLFSQRKGEAHEELLPPTSFSERFASLGNKHSWENPNQRWSKQGLQLLPPPALSSGALKKTFISNRKLSSPWRIRFCLGEWGFALFFFYCRDSFMHTFEGYPPNWNTFC